VGYRSLFISLRIPSMINSFLDLTSMFIHWRYVKPWLDQDSGNSYCLFFPYSPEHLVHSVPKLEGMRPDVSLSISASLEHEHVSGSASALFIGGFSIMEMSKVWHNNIANSLAFLCLKVHIRMSCLFLWCAKLQIQWNPSKSDC